MLEYLGDVVLTRLGCEIDKPSTQWLLDQVFGSVGDPNPRMTALIRETGPLELGRWIIFNPGWLYEVAREYLWPRPECNSLTILWYLGEEIEARRGLLGHYCESIPGIL